MLIGGTRTLPIVGTTQRLVDCGRPLHPVSDDDLFPGLLHDINSTAGIEGPWYAVVMLSNGRGKAGGISETSRMPPPDAFDRMVDLAVKLNAEAHHNGHWIVAWVNGWISGIWRGFAAHVGEDKRSTILIETDLAEPWVRACLWSLNEMAERIEAGYAEGIERYRQH